MVVLVMHRVHSFDVTYKESSRSSYCLGYLLSEREVYVFLIGCKFLWHLQSLLRSFHDSQFSFLPRNNRLEAK